MSRFVASWFGSGLILGKLRGSDLGSGTVGALLALPMSLLLGHYLGWVTQVIAAVVVTLIGLVATRRHRDEGDAGWIVIDEAAGTFLATVGLAVGPALAAFVVFRAADIFKRVFPGVSQAEQLPGEWGIAADDLVAGLYGLAAGHVIQALM